MAEKPGRRRVGRLAGSAEWIRRDRFGAPDEAPNALARSHTVDIRVDAAPQWLLDGEMLWR